MKVLLLTPEPPSAEQVNGGATRQHQLYSRMLELGHEVTVVAPFTAGQRTSVERLRADGFEVLPCMRPRSRTLEVLGAIVRRPTLIASIFTLPVNDLIGAVYWTRMRPIVRELLRCEQFDLIAVEHSLGARWIADLPDDLPTILTNHQVESAYHADRANHRSGVARLLALENARRARRSEARWTPRFTSVVCMSDQEIALLETATGELPSVRAIGNGADYSKLSSVAPDPGEQRILFTGTMGFEPNVLAANFIAREVMPRVRSAAPEATLQLVGRDPVQAVLELDKLDGVSVHASVPDMLPFFESASICTLPMLEGGGTRLKLAEAFAAKRVVVATTNGATGVAVHDRQELLIADGAEAFAGAIIELLDDDELRNAIAMRGNRFGAEHLDWKRLAESWVDVAQQVAADQRFSRS